MRRLDDQSFTLAASKPAVFRAASKPLDIADGVAAISMPPFGLARIDTDIGSG